MDLSEMVPERYRIFFDSKTTLFRILDCWHPSIKNLNLEENPDLPDNSPAVKIISTEEVNALVGELIKLGWLDKIVESKVNAVTADNPKPTVKSTKDLIVEKIADIVIDDGGKPEPHSSVSKDAISALKEIASKL